jgi:hypothetical protein
MFEIETKDCSASHSLHGSMKVVIKGIPQNILGYLDRSACQSVDGREHFECIVEKAPLVLAILARLEELNETRGKGAMEVVHLLSLLDLYWD